MMILNLVLWYLVLGLAGWLVFPLAYRVLAFLPDRGLAFVRPLALLLWGYAFWLLVSLGVLQNDSGGVLFSLLLVGAVSLWQLRGERWREMRGWLGEHRGLALTTEILFLGAFALWVIVRVANPDATGTEKPMELAFINAILRSPSFPPADPWLSGYAISYYYFGYVMVAILARISLTPGAVAFNLALATWFALVTLAAYGLLYNLLVGRISRVAFTRRALWPPLLGPFFLLLVSNLTGFLEMLHARGIFWQPAADGSLQSPFWNWLNILELVQPPAQPLGWTPGRAGGIWWWRASRVLQDFDFAGRSREIIDEFPAFSYILGDLHPHVLSTPFILLALALALNVFLRLRLVEDDVLHLEQWVVTPEFWLTSLVLGGLSFLNTWDFPIYLAFFAAAALLARLARGGWQWDLLAHFIEVFLPLGLAGGLLYLPFYLGFQSQANGLLPSLIYFTRGVYFWVMFASLLLPIIAWLAWLVWKQRGVAHVAWGEGLLLGVGLLAGLWLLSTLLGLRVLSTTPDLAAAVYGAPVGTSLLSASFLDRIASPGTWLSLLILLVVVLALLRARPKRVEEPARRPAGAYPANPVDPFVLLLILLGVGLALFPEFFYLRDQFGWRMNTIFKFYYQVWAVWAIGAAYASVILWQSLRKVWAAVWQVSWVALVMMALVYPIFGIWSRTNGFALSDGTLDSSAYLARYAPQEMEGILWLQHAPYGVVTEAIGGSYTSYARVATLTGLPTVLGWPGHEGQWRGSSKEIGSRESDIAQLYKARTWEQVSTILERYPIRYIFLGDLERGLYHPNEALLEQNLAVVYRNDTVTIFEVPRYPFQKQAGDLP